VRCTTVIRPARGWIAGTNWMAEAPVRTTASKRVGRGQPAEAGPDNDDAEMLRTGFSDHQ
jgi:hypothetical protein